jgi:hypothetical protein
MISIFKFRKSFSKFEFFLIKSLGHYRTTTEPPLDHPQATTELSSYHYRATSYRHRATLIPPPSHPQTTIGPPFTTIEPPLDYRQTTNRLSLNHHQTTDGPPSKLNLLDYYIFNYFILIFLCCT